MNSKRVNADADYVRSLEARHRMLVLKNGRIFMTGSLKNSNSMPGIEKKKVKDLKKKFISQAIPSWELNHGPLA